MASREFLVITPESTYGTYSAPGTPTWNTNVLAVVLDQSNAYSMRKKPTMYNIRDMAGRNRIRQTGSGKYVLQGALNTLFYPSQAAFWIAQGLTMNANYDLPSFTVDHCIMTEDSANDLQTVRTTGVKIGVFNLTADSQSDVFRLKLTLQGQQNAGTAPTLTEPPMVDYPAELPYIFQELASPGFLKLGTNRSEFAGWDLTVTNHLDGTFNESPYITRLKACGRDVSWTTKLVYNSLTDRSNYEAIMATVCEAKLVAGAHNVDFVFNSQNFCTAVDDDLALDKVFYQSLNWQNNYDGAAAGDFTATAV